MPSHQNEELLSLLQNSILSSLNDLSGLKSSGVLKFFNDSKNFGFFVNESDGEDVFFHYDDIKDTKLSKDFLRESKNKYLVKFAFNIQMYYGKHSNESAPSKKAINIELLGMVDMKFIQKHIT